MFFLHENGYTDDLADNNDDDYEHHPPSPEIPTTGYGSITTVSFGKNTPCQFEDNRPWLGLFFTHQVQERMGR
jgi:hypothetical protein